MNFINRARTTVGMGLARAGSTIRKIGDVSAPVIRKVGQISGVLGKIAPIVGMALAPATGGLSLGLGAAAGKVLGAVAGVAGKAGGISEGISKFGGRLQTAGQTISGMPQGSSPYGNPAEVMVSRGVPMGMGGSRR